MVVQCTVIFWRVDRVFLLCGCWRHAYTDSRTCYLCFPTVSYYAGIIRSLTMHPQKRSCGDLERDHFFNKKEAFFTSKSILVFPGVGIDCIAFSISIQLHVMVL